MLYWNRFPFIRIGLSFATGILAGNLEHRIGIFPYCVAVLLFLFLILRFIQKRHYQPDRVPLYGFTAFLIFFSLGFIHMQDRKNRIREARLAGSVADLKYFYAEITSLNGRTAMNHKVTAVIHLVNNGDEWITANCKVLLYIPLQTAVQYGDYLLVRGHPTETGKPLNPFEFDYREFLFRKGILYTGFLRQGRFTVVRNLPGNYIISFATMVREKITGSLTSRMASPGVSGMLGALITGSRDLVGEETIATFADTGIIHILAVSGLHVGILYILLFNLLRPLAGTRTGRWVRMLVIMCFFVFFAFLTGLSASVLRAVLMFSLILVGLTIERNAHVLNSVFLSAFILLLLNPFFLYNVGFQLSYMAVFGIIVLQPVIRGFYEPRRFVVYRAWELISVSIAAQLATIPLTLYYFGQFPLYFLPANLVAIPAVSIILPGTALLLAVSPVPYLSGAIAVLCEQTGKLFLAVIGLIRSLPGAVIRPVDINPVQSVLLFAAVYTACLMITRKSSRMAWLSALSLAAVVLIDATPHTGRHGVSIVAFNIPGRTCIELLDGNSGLMLTGTDDSATLKRISYRTTGYCTHKRHRHTWFALNNPGDNLPHTGNDAFLVIVWNQKLIGIIGGPGGLKYLETFPHSLDALVIRRNALTPAAAGDLPVQPAHIIWDSSNSALQQSGSTGRPDVTNPECCFSGFREVQL